MKNAFIFLLLLLIAITGSVLTEFNLKPVLFHYYFSAVELPLALLLFMAFTLGALLGLALSLGMVISIRKKKRRIKNKLHVCQQEIRNLRDIPIKGRH